MIQIHTRKLRLQQSRDIVASRVSIRARYCDDDPSRGDWLFSKDQNRAPTAQTEMKRAGLDCRTNAADRWVWMHMNGAMGWQCEK